AQGRGAAGDRAGGRGPPAPARPSRGAWRPGLVGHRAARAAAVAGGRRPVAGAAAGVLAGGAGAFAYAFHCPELAAPFLAVWYVLGMAMPVVAGALIGPRLLRW